MEGSFVGKIFARCCRRNDLDAIAKEHHLSTRETAKFKADYDELKASLDA